MTHDHFMDISYSSILFHARLNPDAIAISYAGHSNVTYAEFVTSIEKATRRLSAVVEGRVGPIAVHAANRYLHWLLLIALGRIGLTSVSVFDISSDGPLELLKADTVLSDRDVNASDQRFIRIDEQWLKPELHSLPPFTEPIHKPDAPFRIALSSGTTGMPKKILLTYRQMDYRVRNLGIMSGLSSASRVMVMLGVDTGVGYQVPISTWSVGGTVVFGMPNEDLYRFILRTEITHLFMSPAHLGRLVNTMLPNARPIPSLAITVGGSALPTSVNEKARLRLTPSLFSLYGSTETGSVVRGYASIADVDSTATGYVLPWATVQAVDAAGNPVANGTAGELRIRSTGAVTQYMSDPSDGAPSSPNESDANNIFKDGWFYPGDEGIVTDAGMVCIVGRTRDLINVGGMKIAPAAIEEALSSSPGVADIAAFAADYTNGLDRPWVAVVAGEGFQPDALVERYKQKFPRLPPINIARIPEIPRNAMGKIQRAELRKLVMNRAGKPAERK